MRYISSDTNVFIDIDQIGRLKQAFLLDCVFCMSSDTVEAELLSPPDLRERLIALGLRVVEIDQAEFELVTDYARYGRLSFYDRLALAIAKHRGYILLSGDAPLRRAAASEGVEVRGTLWVFDQLLEQRKIDRDEYRAAMRDLLGDESGRIRLPKDEIKKRLER